MKKRIIKKRSLYEFTMRCIHDLYKEQVREYLLIRNFDESVVPSLLYIHDSLENLRDCGRKSNKSSFYNASGKDNSIICHRHNYDLTEMSKTKDWTDFDKNFLRYLRLSRE